MKDKKFALFLILFLFCNTLITACSNTTAGEIEPQGIPINVTVSTVNLSNYTHPSNCFKLLYPVGWEIVEHDTSVTFNAPDDSSTIEVIIVNTGYELETVSFENFINAAETNWFGTYKNYQETMREDNPEKGYSRRVKTLDWNKIPQNVSSIYQKKGEVVYWLNFWENQASISSIQSVFEQIIESISYDPTYCADLTPYNSSMPFSGPYGLFSIQVPIQWIHTSERGDVYQIDTFFSPDSKAAIQNITHDDGKTVTRGTADIIALDYLKEIYAKDVFISEARVQSDNSIRWIWKSLSGGFQGTTFYETRGTTFLMLTIMYINDQKEVYFPPLDFAISSYTIPQ